MPLLLPNLLNIFHTASWINNKRSGIKGRVIYFIVIPIKGVLSVSKAFRELLIRYILLLAPSQLRPLSITMAMIVVQAWCCASR